MNRANLMLAGLAAVALLGLVLLVWRPFEYRLPGGAAAGAAGRSFQPAQLEKAGRLLYGSKPLSRFQRGQLVDASAVSAAVVKLAAKDGITVSVEDAARLKTSVPAGFPPELTLLWSQRMIALERYGKKHAGKVQTPSQAVVASKARRLRQSSVQPEQRSFIEVATKSRSQADKAAAIISLDNGGIIARKYSDDGRIIATGGETQLATADSLKPKVRALVFATPQGSASQPQRIGGRWRVFLVTEVVAPPRVPSLSVFENQVRRDLGIGAWNIRRRQAEQSLVRRATRQVRCSSQWFVPRFCGTKG